MPSPNTSWPEITTTTLYNRSKKLQDSVSKNNALLNRLSKKGKIKTFDGGQAIIQELEYAENSTVKRYSGYDPLNISPSDAFTSAQFPIAQIAGAVSISGLEMLQNSGESKMIDLLDARIGNLERTLKNVISADCYSSGTADGGKQIGGLGLLVPDAPTTGTVGGIDRATWHFWRPALFDFSVAALTPSATTIQTAMNRLYLQLTVGSDAPDLIIADNTYFRYYWESLQSIQRIASDKEASAGFMSLKFMNADVIYDGGFQGVTGATTWSSSGAVTGAPASHMWMLNTDYINLRPHKDRNMVPLDPVDGRFSVNQDAMVKLMAWAGNMTLSNAFKHGVMID